MIFQLLIKDIKLLFKNRKVLLLIIAMPIVLSTILGYTFGGNESDDIGITTIKIDIVKQYDVDDESQRFSDNLKEENLLTENQIDDLVRKGNISTYLFTFLDQEDTKEFITYEIVDLETAKKHIDEKKISAYVLLPENYIYHGLQGFYETAPQTTIHIVKSPYSRYKSVMAEDIITGFHNRIYLQMASKAILTEEFSKFTSYDFSRLGPIMEEVVSKESALRFKNKKIAQEKEVSGLAHYTAAMLCSYMLFSGAFVAQTLLTDKRMMVLDRVKTVGVTDGMLYVSKYIYAIFVVFLQASIMMAFSKVVFDVSWQPLGSIILIIFMGSNVIASFSVLLGIISIRIKSYKLISAFNSVFNQVLSVIGGNYLPLASLPPVFGILSKLTINGLILSSILHVMKGHSLKTISENLIIMVIMTILLLLCTAIFFRMSKKEERG